MPAAFKFGCQKQADAVDGVVEGDKPFGQAQDIGVVVLTDQLGNGRLPHERGPDARMLVGRHGNALPAATYQHALVGLPALNRRRDGVGVVG